MCVCVCFVVRTVCVCVLVRTVCMCVYARVCGCVFRYMYIVILSEHLLFYQLGGRVARALAS